MRSWLVTAEYDLALSDSCWRTCWFPPWNRDTWNLERLFESSSWRMGNFSATNEGKRVLSVSLLHGPKLRPLIKLDRLPALILLLTKLVTWWRTWVHSLRLLLCPSLELTVFDCQTTPFEEVKQRRHLSISLLSKVSASTKNKTAGLEDNDDLIYESQSLSLASYTSRQNKSLQINLLFNRTPIKPPLAVDLSSSGWIPQAWERSVTWYCRSELSVAWSLPRILRKLDNCVRYRRGPRFDFPAVRVAMKINFN